MNLRERIQLRVLINFIVSLIERIVRLSQSLSKKDEVKPKPNKKPKPLKDLLDSIVPWRKKDE
jgi:hypothetical protein